MSTYECNCLNITVSDSCVPSVLQILLLTFESHDAVRNWNDIQGVSGGILTLRLLMSYIYIYMEHLFLMFLDHTQRRTTVGRTPLDE